MKEPSDYYYRDDPDNRPGKYYQAEYREFSSREGDCGDISDLRAPEARLYTDVRDKYNGEKTLREVYLPKSQYYSQPGGQPKRYPAGSLEYYYETCHNQQHHYCQLADGELLSPTTATPNYHTATIPPSYPSAVECEDPCPVYGNEDYNNAPVDSDYYYYDDDPSGPPVVNWKTPSSSTARPATHVRNNNTNYNNNDDNNNYKVRVVRGTTDAYADCRDKGYGYGKTKKKYPITVKTPKYISRNFIATTVNRQPSALCLPLITQPDPALVKRKGKIARPRKHPEEPSAVPATNIQYCTCEPYAARKMHSEGDFNQYSCEGEAGQLTDKDLRDEIQENIQQVDESFKELAKFLKPRVPLSIKIQQEKLAAKSEPPPAAKPPKLKLSLDKLLNRLQKCEPPEGKADGKDDRQRQELQEKFSVNYEELNGERATNRGKETLPDKNETAVDETNHHHRPNALFKSSDRMKLLKPMDDNCALDLHRSKSYIVDLIDRALSKELGTMPRIPSTSYRLTPDRAITAIDRHVKDSGGTNELCYELTHTLTDSIISNVTAAALPKETDNRQVVGRSTSDGQIEDDNNYIKQLKRLRWGHIRHIQYEARKLADLEEFLEKCGEIDY